jgi:hypothetical protein
MASAEHNPMPGTVTGQAATILRLEAAAECVAAVTAFHLLGGSWGMFAALCLAPDLTMLGYLGGIRLGTITYNVGHNYLSPAAVALIGALLHWDLLFLLAAIWVAHIGFDRMLGYGLKYTQGFGATHLGWKVQTKATSM